MINVSDDDDLLSAYEVASKDLSGNLKLSVVVKMPAAAILATEETKNEGADKKTKKAKKEKVTKKVKEPKETKKKPKKAAVAT